MPWALILIFCLLVTADLILIALAIFGAIRSRIEYQSYRSTGHALRNASKAASTAGALLAAAGVFVELSDVWSLIESNRRLEPANGAVLLVSVMVAVLGMNVYAWGRAMMNLRMPVLDVVMFYVTAALAIVITLAGMLITISDAMLSRATLSDGTVLIVEGICCALLVWAMVAVSAALKERNRERAGR